MRHWSGLVDRSCVLCNDPLETMEHLFFECEYSAQIWKQMMEGVLLHKYTNQWERIMRIMIRPQGSKVKSFVIKYMFQLAIHTIWRERNRRRHGESPSPVNILASLIDKGMRNKLTIIQRRKDKDLEGGMIYWFSTRI